MPQIPKLIASPHQRNTKFCSLLALNHIYLQQIFIVTSATNTAGLNVMEAGPGLHNTFFLRSIRFRFFLKRSSTSAAITIVSKLGSRYQFQLQFLKHWRFDLSFNSNRGSIQCSITTTISVAVQAICNFNFGSIAAVFTMQSQLQYQ